MAELVMDGDGLGLAYIDDLDSALEAGSKGYPGLPLAIGHESRRATDVLKRRLPAQNRPDFNEFKERFGLSRNADFTVLSLLAYTGARLSSDSFGISETFEGFDQPFRYVFDITGYRHYREEVLDLEEEPVSFRHEPTNPDDADAVKVVCRNDAGIGYINRLQTGPVHCWIRNGRIDARMFRINGRSAYPRLFVIADIVPKCQRIEG